MNVSNPTWSSSSIARCGAGVSVWRALCTSCRCSQWYLIAKKNATVDTRVCGRPDILPYIYTGFSAGIFVYRFAAPNGSAILWPNAVSEQKRYPRVPPRKMGEDVDLVVLEYDLGFLHHGMGSGPSRITCIQSTANQKRNWICTLLTDLIWAISSPSDLHRRYIKVEKSIE